MTSTTVADLLAKANNDTRTRNDTLRTNYDDFAGDIVIRHRMQKLKDKIKANSAIYKILGDNYNGMVTLEGNFQYSFQILDVTDIAQKVDKYEAIRQTAISAILGVVASFSFNGPPNILNAYLDFAEMVTRFHTGNYMDRVRAKKKRSAEYEALMRMTLPDIKDGDYDKIHAVLIAGRDTTGRYIHHTPDSRISNFMQEISYLADQPFVEQDPIDPPKLPELVGYVKIIARRWAYLTK